MHFKHAMHLHLKFTVGFSYKHSGRGRDVQNYCLFYKTFRAKEKQIVLPYACTSLSLLVKYIRRKVAIGTKTPLSFLYTPDPFPCLYAKEESSHKATHEPAFCSCTNLQVRVSLYSIDHRCIKQKCLPIKTKDIYK